jgi:peptidoglycan/LPS O-acetylase OafA/YrhL
MGAVRLFLALVVAYDHWRANALGPKGISLDTNLTFGFNAGQAVMFFYVVSGFLITYGLSHKYGDDKWAFYKARFIRIFSLYWPLVLAAFLLVPKAWAEFSADRPLGQFTGIFLIGVDWTVTFSSYLRAQGTIEGLHQAWTLGAELLFYLAAPLFMRSWKIGMALLAASFIFRAVLVIVNGPGFGSGIWNYYFIGSTFGFFMLGHLVCLASQRWGVLSNRTLGFVLLVSSFVFMNEGGRIPAFDTPYFWAGMLCFTLSLPGLFEATRDVRWLNVLGELSYPVYLVHGVVVSAWARPLLPIILDHSIASPLAIGYGTMVVYLLVTIVASVAAHRWLEIPVANLMRSIRLPKRV